MNVSQPDTKRIDEIGSQYTNDIDERVRKLIEWADKQPPETWKD